MAHSMRHGVDSYSFLQEESVSILYAACPDDCLAAGPPAQLLDVSHRPGCRAEILQDS